MAYIDAAWQESFRRAVTSFYRPERDFREPALRAQIDACLDVLHEALQRGDRFQIEILKDILDHLRAEAIALEIYPMVTL